ncbi:hypothetical protein DSL72_006340 [Monilinia vaccinii-corymbosi]|uniref:Mitochondrial inner membrane protease subunit 2 n=1 Tax=Monilinia vaccinii-corymbosi TaxID=61207 RepID=A0A8A3PNK3_9HELO|nr:hypothetical protein DSL72_006340 [Monilinia vaccinii-corymbosi]
MSQRLFSALKKGFPTRSFLKDFSYCSFVIASWVPAVIFLKEHVVEFHTIKGASMYPFLNTGYNESLTRDFCLVDKRNPTKGLERGMLVSFRFVPLPSLYFPAIIRIGIANSFSLPLRSPYHPENLVVKRIIALEGDRVYTHSPYPYPIADVPAGHVWVEGDNADARKTLDSHHYGPIAVNLIRGRLTHVLWPWRSRGAIDWRMWKGRTRVVRGE